MQPTRRSSLFLLELMLAILLFCLAAAICVQVFVKSHIIEKKSTELNQAVLASASAAEIIRSSDDPFSVLMGEFPDAERKANSISIYYDKDWTLTDSSGSHYILSLETKTEDGFLKASISVCEITREEEPIYKLTVKKYMAEEGASL